MSSEDEDVTPTKKLKTTDDNTAGASTSALPQCPYGERCYRKNPAHFKEFSHPPKGGTKTPTKTIPLDTSKLPECPFGAKCYRKNLLHFAEYSHPFTGGGTDGGADDLPEDDSGSDTDVYEEEEEEKDTTAKEKPSSSKFGPSLTKSYSQMTETERKDLIKKAIEAKQQLEEELAETKKQVEEKEKQLDQLQTEVNEGMLLMEGEKEALEHDDIKYFDLIAERSFKEGSAAQAHFRLAESQFYRLLGGAVMATGNYRVKKVQYIVNPKLYQAFKEAKVKLKKVRGEKYSYPILAFHGTQVKNIKPIVETGFKVPGEDGFAHRTDNGYYGCGVYFSEYPNYSMGYIQGCNKILLCQVLLGKTYQCSQLIQGKPLMKGYDSHISPNKKELIIFSSAHILPCYLVHYNNSNAEFKYQTQADCKKIKKTREELMKLYWKASKAKKTVTMAGYYFRFSGRLCNTQNTLKALVKKHGALEHHHFGAPVGAAAEYFNIIVCTEKCLPSLNAKAEGNVMYQSPRVHEQFIYDSIIAGARQDVDDYTMSGD